MRTISYSIEDVIRKLNFVRAWNKNRDAKEHLDIALAIIAGGLRKSKNGRLLQGKGESGVGQDT